MADTPASTAPVEEEEEEEEPFYNAEDRRNTHAPYYVWVMSAAPLVVLANWVSAEQLLRAGDLFVATAISLALGAVLMTLLFWWSGVPQWATIQLVGVCRAVQLPDACQQSLDELGKRCLLEFRRRLLDLFELWHSRFDGAFSTVQDIVLRGSSIAGMRAVEKKKMEPRMGVHAIKVYRMPDTSYNKCSTVVCEIPVYADIWPLRFVEGRHTESGNKLYYKLHPKEYLLLRKLSECGKVTGFKEFNLHTEGWCKASDLQEPTQIRPPATVASSVDLWRDVGCLSEFLPSRVNMGILGTKTAKRSAQKVGKKVGKALKFVGRFKDRRQDDE